MVDAKLLQFTALPQETVELVEGGFDTSDYGTDELCSVVYSLLEAGRADLALPLFVRVCEGVDDLLSVLMQYEELVRLIASADDAPPAGE